MGRYLNHIKEYEAKRVQKPSLDLHARYREVAEQLQEECAIIDPSWLLDHPDVWVELRELDAILCRLEKEEEEKLHHKTLERLRQSVENARALYEAECKRVVNQ